MNKAEARRAAHSAIASLVDVNLEAGDGDLFAGTDDYSEADLARFTAAAAELVDYHHRRGER